MADNNAVLLDAHGVPAEISTKQFSRTDADLSVYLFSATPGRAPGRTPELGEHTRAMLAEIELERTRIDDLCEAGVAVDFAEAPP